MPIKPLSIQKLRRVADPKRLPLKTTDDLPLVDEIIGQPRAVRAIEFGINVREPGFNIFVVGPSGTGRMTTVERFLDRHAAIEPVPDDWVYVHNFKDPLRPRAMGLPAGRAWQFRQDMIALIKHLKTDLPPAFETDEYQQAVSKIKRELDEARGTAFEQLETQTRAHGFVPVQSEQGIFVVPMGADNQPATPEALAALPQDRQAELARAQPDMEDALAATLRTIRGHEQHARERLLDLDRRTAAQATAHVLDSLITAYEADCPEAAEYLEEVRADIIEHVEEFRSYTSDPTAHSAADPTQPLAPDPLVRCQVNVIVDHSQTHGAPVIVETNPTFMNLVGRIERDLRFGDTVLDFSMLRAGALHRANGGYLVLRAQDVLKDVSAWEALKRALNTGRVVIEDPGSQTQMFSTRTLESEPVPLAVKVILLGTPELYYELYGEDEDFYDLFKVKADFALEMDRTAANERAYASFVRARCAEHQLPAFDAGAVAQLIEYGSRLAEDQKKLSTHFGTLTDLIIEAVHWAKLNHRPQVTAPDIRQALDEWRYRSNLYEQQTYEVITDGTINVQVTGEVVGQINGLSVVTIGDYQFGQPARISARTYVGRSGVVSIEREAHLSGRIYNKGVLILDGYLGGQYALKQALTLAASISFEQSYSEIEGDSASSAELYALLSSLADLPIKQSIAVTGSVDQRGRVQPVGGVQYKVEGFFDVCRARGLTGDQGVMIPTDNVRNLMLRDDVVDACRQGSFHVWAIRTIDEGLELLTGVKAGRRGKTGKFPEGSLHARVEARLKAIADELDGGKPDEAGKKPRSTSQNNNS